MLPTSIIHLQLRWVSYTAFEQVASALPCLSSLDVCCKLYQHSTSRWNSAFGTLSNLTKLQSLGVCVQDLDAHGYLDHKQALTRLPELAQTAERGLKLYVIRDKDELDRVFGYPRDDKTVWVHHG